MEPLEDRRLLSVFSNDNGWAASFGPFDADFHIQDMVVDAAGNSLVSGFFSGIANLC